MNASRPSRKILGISAALFLTGLDVRSSEIKPVLYVGTDVALQQGSTFFPVMNVSGGYMEIRPGKEKKKFSSFNLPGLKFEQKVKVSTTEAELEKVKIERAYTPENDPNKRFMENAHNHAFIQDMGSIQRDSAYSERQDHFGSFARARDNQGPGGKDPATMEREMQERESSNLRTSDQLMSRDFGAINRRVDLDTHAEMFDAIDVRFEIRCDMPIANPYLILIAQYKHLGDEENKIRNWIYGYDMDPIGPKSTVVKFKQGGFEPGFQLLKTEVHVYHQGREIPTNLSDKRVPLSLQDAAKFTLAQHLATNKGATVSATPVVTPMPPDYRTRFSEDVLAQNFFVVVGVDGRVKEVGSIKGKKETVASPVVEVVNNFIFNPALEKGQPVESKTMLRLADFL